MFVLPVFPLESVLSNKLAPWPARTDTIPFCPLLQANNKAVKPSSFMIIIVISSDQRETEQEEEAKEKGVILNKESGVVFEQNEKQCLLVSIW